MIPLPETKGRKNLTNREISHQGLNLSSRQVRKGARAEQRIAKRSQKQIQMAHQQIAQTRNNSRQ